MSWIKEVKDEISNIDSSKKNLVKFGLLVGFVFTAIGTWLIRDNLEHFVGLGFIFAGASLLLGVFLFPTKLRNVYRIWMAFAFFAGAIVSRLILAMIFLFVVTPIGFVAKWAQKEFMDLDFRSSTDSYWIPKERKDRVAYDKMY